MSRVARLRAFLRRILSERPRGAVAAAVLIAIVIAGCGSTHTASTSRATVEVPSSAAGAMPSSCPQAADGHGSMGACTPSGYGATGNPTVANQIRFQDRSNNNPCDCGHAIRAQGNRALVVKILQGGFIDTTARAMVASAKGAGLAVGGYDFDQDYTVSEAVSFDRLLREDGITPKGRNETPVWLDVEYGSFSLTGLKAQVRYMQSRGWRVGIYTGGWYWTPHAGCTVLPTVYRWISGYPNIVPFCGSGSITDHQYSDSPVDESVHLVGSWASFTNTVPVKRPKPKPAPHRTPAQERLAALIARQHLLRHLEAKHACKTRPRGYGACAHWLPEGQRVDREILNQPGGIT